VDQNEVGHEQKAKLSLRQPTVLSYSRLSSI